jgi:2-alkyl-3-oxoalkanoate reductase
MGHRVRALVRRIDAADRLRDAGVELVQGDLARPAALGRLTVDADVLIHMAGAVRGACREDFERINVEGTARLIEATGQRTALIFMSSLAAREPGLSHYAASKARAEDLLFEQRGSRHLYVLRPPAVYGPGDTELLPLFRFMARTGIAPIAGTLRARYSLIHAADLVRAVVSLLDRLGEAGECRRYTLHDGTVDGYDWPEICAIASRICGRTIHPRRIPPTLLDLIAAGNRRAATWLGYAPMLTPEKLRELRHPNWVCDNAQISADTAWAPRIALEEGLRSGVQWLQ